MYSNILGAAYIEYSKYKNEDAYNSSVWFVTTVQFLHFFLFLGIIHEYSDFKIFSVIDSPIIIIPITIIFTIASFKYYNRKRVETIVSRYRRKNKIQRLLWGVFSILILIVSISLFPILFSK